MADATKAQLESKLEELQSELEAKEAELEGMAGVLARLSALELKVSEQKKAPETPAPKKVFGEPQKIVRPDRIDGGGWEVRTVNKKYSGVSCGIRFAGGLGLVWSQQPESDRIVKDLEYDLGYSVVPRTRDEMIQLIIEQTTARELAEAEQARAPDAILGRPTPIGA